MLPPDGALRRFPLVGEWIIGLARNHLALGDSLAAEQQLRRVDVGLETPQFPRWLGLVFELGRPWLGRAWLLSGTLAEARGRPADARSNYERLIGLWEAADPEFSVLVEEARTRVARLPPQR